MAGPWVKAFSDVKTAGARDIAKTVTGQALPHGLMLPCGEGGLQCRVSEWHGVCKDPLIFGHF